MASASAADASRIDRTQMEHLMRAFHDSWRGGIEAINRDVVKSFANFRLGMEILKQVLTQLLLYYTRFQDIARRVPGEPAFLRDLVSIQTIMHEIKKYSRAF